MRINSQLHSKQLIPSLTVGLIVGILEVVLAISFAALIFGGPLRPFLVNGIGITLIGAIACGTVVTLLTSAPGTAAGSQDIPSAIMAVVVATIAASAIGDTTGAAVFSTVVVAIALTTMLSGVFFYFLARFRIGQLVSYLPYPVVAGFLATTGWLLVLGGINIMVDVTPGLDNINFLLGPTQLVRWLPGLLFGGLILVALERIDNVFSLPVLLAGSVTLFYALAAARGYSLETLLSAGWLLGPFPEYGLLQPWGGADLTLVDFPAIARQIPNIATLILMSSIALLLNSSGLEVTIGQDIAIDRELRAAGIGNLFAGALGGLVAFQQLSLSTMSHKVGGASRLTGLVAAVVCLFVLFMGASVLSLIPRIIIGGFICYLGLAFLEDTIIADRSTLPRGDYAVILLILIVAATVGFLEAIGVGLLVAVLLFVVDYSRTEFAGDELSGSVFRSRVTRSPDKRRFLDELGEQIHILRLQGFIFFGTADSLLSRIRARLEDDDRMPVRFLVLDFHNVTGVDSTTALSFVKLVRLAQKEGFHVVLAEPVSRLARQIETMISVEDTVHVFSDLDRGLEWCEEQVLTEVGIEQGGHGGLLQELLHSCSYDKDMASRMLSYFERQKVNAGEYLMRQGDAPDYLYLIESGQMSAFLEEKDGRTVRLQTMQDWNVLGEIGFFLNTERTASIVAEAPGVIYCLSQEALARMRANDPALASAFQQLVMRLLAERVVHLVNVVEALRH